MNLEDMLTPLHYTELSSLQSADSSKLFRIMSLDELSNIYADDWYGFISMMEDSDGNLEDYCGWTHFKSFSTKVTKNMIQWYLGRLDVIVEFDRDKIEKIIPPQDAKILPYTFDKEGEDDFELRLFTYGYEPFKNLDIKVSDAISTIYIPRSNNEVMEQFEDYFDLEHDSIAELKVISDV